MDRKEKGLLEIQDKVYANKQLQSFIPLGHFVRQRQTR